MELAIDSVGQVSSVAVSERGRVLAEITWPTGRRHTPTLVPQIDAVCTAASIERESLEAVFVDVGPGAYGGIRAGMAAAAAICVARGLPAVGLSRLEIEAAAHAVAAGPIVALHNAGRGQWAVGVYTGPAAHWREEAEPALVTLPELARQLEVLGEVGVLCGEVAELGEDVIGHLSQLGWTVGGAAASMRRAGLLAELAWRILDRGLAAGQSFAPERLEPLYLREPAIGPQQPVEGAPFPLETSVLETTE
jgi:tRNA threonylcarbamoyladenosine biosynthesis protein TsaB